MSTPTYNPWRADVQEDPYPTYHALRSADPVHFHPYARIWFLTRHRDCLALLRDPRFSARLGQTARTRDDPLPPSMLTTDPPEHARLRGPAHKLFAPGALVAVHKRLSAIAQRLLDDMATRGEGDVVADLAAPLAVEILGALVGVPQHEMARFDALAVAASGNLDPLAPPDAQAQATQAADELDRFLAEQVATPASDELDLVGQLLRRERGGELTDDEVDGIGTLMVIGGYEPMVHLIGNGVLALLRDRDALERLRAGDDGLVRSAVDELLRFDSPIQFAARSATVDAELGGTTIPCGDAVIALLGAANRDPEVFADPDRLDLGRRPNAGLGFGAGPHACLGAPLARLAGRVAIPALVRRFPALRLAGEPLRGTAQVPRGLTALPVHLRDA